MRNSLTTKCSLEFEEALMRGGVSRVAGIDEAGRGPLAGPVVAAAVILPRGFSHTKLNDSKKLSARAREQIYQELLANGEVIYAVAVVEADIVDRMNILRATHHAMRIAVSELRIAAEHALIDGLPVAPFPIPQTALVKGDSRSFSIAAASVLAKVTRDWLMLAHDERWPQYGFAKHKGYATAQHLAKLREHGPCPIHRRSFEPVSQRLLF